MASAAPVGARGCTAGCCTGGCEGLPRRVLHQGVRGVHCRVLHRRVPPCGGLPPWVRGVWGLRGRMSSQRVCVAAWVLAGSLTPTLAAPLCLHTPCTLPPPYPPHPRTARAPQHRCSVCLHTLKPPPPNPPHRCGGDQGQRHRHGGLHPHRGGVWAEAAAGVWALPWWGLRVDGVGRGVGGGWGRPWGAGDGPEGREGDACPALSLFGSARACLVLRTAVQKDCRPSGVADCRRGPATPCPPQATPTPATSLRCATAASPTWTLATWRS